jgi:B9 domain-containing protein 2
MAEVHIVGSLVGGKDFDQSGLFCKWHFVTDDGRPDNKRWMLLEGAASGQTQVDVNDNSDTCVWATPIDVHYSTTTIHGWPKFSCEVWSQDAHGRNMLAGYGFCHVPSTPGEYDLRVCCWRPKPQSWLEFVSSFFLGTYPRLKNPDLVWRQDDRYRLNTVTVGTVQLKLTVVTQGFERQGVLVPAPSAMPESY